MPWCWEQAFLCFVEGSCAGPRKDLLSLEWLIEEARAVQERCRLDSRNSARQEDLLRQIASESNLARRGNQS